MEELLLLRKGFKMMLLHLIQLNCSSQASKWKLVQVKTVTSVVRNNLDFSQIVVTFNMQRNEPFYTLTLFLPILILTVLAPIGLILPGRNHQFNSGTIFKLRYFSWCWRKDGTSNHSFACRCYLRWYPPVNCSNFWQFGQYSAYFDVFRCFDYFALYLLATYNSYVIPIPLSGIWSAKLFKNWS